MATTKRLLPVGIQDFADIRTRGFVYVDKTARAYDLITGSGKAFFIADLHERLNEKAVVIILDGTAEAALAQIDTKEYAIPWTGRGKKVFKVGVTFDFEKRNIGEWVSALGAV
jgi:hypothetical protein